MSETYYLEIRDACRAKRQFSIVDHRIGLTVSDFQMRRWCDWRPCHGARRPTSRTPRASSASSAPRSRTRRPTSSGTRTISSSWHLPSNAETEPPLNPRLNSSRSKGKMPDSTRARPAIAPDYPSIMLYTNWMSCVINFFLSVSNLFFVLPILRL